MLIGKVETLSRYPVKSLLGEFVEAVDIEKRGVRGDRLYAISNEQGKFGSGKNTRHFRKIDGLLCLSAQFNSDTLLITFPCGESLNSDHQDINQKLSTELGQAVTLTKENDLPHFDDGSVHIITSADLEQLKLELPESQIDIRRFRANILIDTHSLSRDLLGKTLRIRDTEMAIVEETKRCRMIGLAQGTLNHDPKILEMVAKQHNHNFGVYATVVRPGLINVGDSISIV
ncbi:MAG: MOSC domain-containing protein [Arenicella sp.]|jgi:uncharacterized protein YcbX|nr:MOSC domain-containing protein [Arenicella sp.]